MPAPFGPTRATRSPSATASETSRRIARRPRLDRHAVGIEHEAHSSYPVRARRRRTRKNGAPMIAVITPTGTPPNIRATRSAIARKLAPNSIEIGSTRRAFGPDEQADDVRHDEPDEPDQAGDRDPCGRDERREPEEDHALAADVDAEVRRGLLAEQEPVEGA